jgi:hypothetical protein
MGTNLSLNAAFAGTSTQGLWTLSISDNAGGDLGAFTGWGLNIQSAGAAVPEPGSALVLLGAGALAMVRRRR